MPKLCLEQWQSTDHKLEHHYFLDDDNREVYVFGLNYKLFNAEAEQRIKLFIQAELEAR